MELLCCYETKKEAPVGASLLFIEFIFLQAIPQGYRKRRCG
jgi:hypothetical protein